VADPDPEVVAIADKLTFNHINTKAWKISRPFFSRQSRNPLPPIEVTFLSILIPKIPDFIMGFP
jgi:hypothetical protein